MFCIDIAPNKGVKPAVRGIAAQLEIRKASRQATIMALHDMERDSIDRREKVLRRLLKEAGYNLKKSPAKHWTREHYGVGYMVIDDRNVVVCGATQREYDATLLQVACFMEGIGLKPGI
jgi:hypothetical protein